MKKLVSILIVGLMMLQMGICVNAQVPEGTFTGTNVANENVVENGDFEVGTITPWYLPSADYTLALAEGAGVGGSDCLEGNNTTGARPRQRLAQLSSAKAGNVYQITAKMKLKDNTKKSTDAFIKLSIDDGANWKYLSTGYTVTGTDWTVLSYVYTVESDLTQAPVLQLVPSNSTNYGEFYLDDVLVKRVNGFVVNGEFENNTIEPWYLPSTDYTLALAEGVGVDGTDCLVGNNTYGARPRQTLTQLSSAKAGEIYRITAKMKLKDNTKTSTDAFIKLSIDSGASWKYLSTGYTVTGTDWTVLSYVYTVETDLTQAPVLQVVASNATNYGEFYLDDVYITNTPLYGNLVKNGNFEDNTNSWYTPDASAGLTLAEGLGVNGSNCAKVGKSTVGRLSQKIDDILGAKAGETYCISAKIKMADEGKETNRARIKFGTTVTDYYGVTSDKWVTMTMLYNVTSDITVSGDSTTRLQVYANEDQVDCGAYYVDDVVIYKVGTISPVIETEKTATHVTADIDIYNTDDSAITGAVAVIALYEDNMLVGCEIKNVDDIAKYSASKTNVSIAIDDDYPNADAKLFIWDGFDKMIPLCEFIEIK